jgi:hypothetical protein
MKHANPLWPIDLS